MQTEVLRSTATGFPYPDSRAKVRIAQSATEARRFMRDPVPNARLGLRVTSAPFSQDELNKVPKSFQFLEQEGRRAYGVYSVPLTGSATGPIGEEVARCAYAFGWNDLLGAWRQDRATPETESWESCRDLFNVYLGRRFNPRERFNRLAAAWRKDVRFLSDTNEICTHPAYQEIIGMGVLALPFIFAELGREPADWFWALKAITGEDPVLDDHRGDLHLMTKAWLDWADTRTKAVRF